MKHGRNGGAEQPTFVRGIKSSFGGTNEHCSKVT
jgi:hypothetical protein